MNSRRYSVVWTEVALRDIEQLVGYLEDESPLRVDQLLSQILRRGDSLKTSPERGRTLPELRAIGDRTWREVQQQPWRIIYRISARRVEIHGVLDGRRSLEDLLMERFLRA